MRKTTKIFLLLLGVLLQRGCVEPFNPEITRYENLLVVEGVFTNAEEDHVVKLGRSYEYYDAEMPGETGAVVAIMDDRGNMAFYTETQPGVYTLDHEQMNGTIGHSYKILIETSDGKSYESDYQVLKKPVEIDSIFYEIKEGNALETGYNKDGLQIYVNSRDEENNTLHYRWDWTDTWEFTVPHIKPGFESRTRCWNSRISSNITIFNTTELESDYVYRKKLNFIPAASATLSILLSTEVRQYSLTSEAYDFWRKLELATEHTGSLFDPPPTPVLGNIENTEDPYEPVLGFFEVSGISKKRIFIRRSELPKSLKLTTGNEHCEGLVIMGEGLTELRRGWYLLDRYTWMDTLWTSLSNSIDCYDCTVKGENERPEYWPTDDENE